MLPMADLLLGTTAILLLVVLVLAPRLGWRDAPPRGMPDDAALWTSAADGPVIVAGAGGLALHRTGGAAPARIDAGAIAAFTVDPRAVPLLVIASGGDEAAFLLEARLAALGTSTIRRVRLPPGCRSISGLAADALICD